jgi:hypothetical protein
MSEGGGVIPSSQSNPVVLKVPALCARRQGSHHLLARLGVRAAWLRANIIQLLQASWPFSLSHLCPA